MIAAAEVEQESRTIATNKLRSSPKEMKLKDSSTPTGFFQALYYSDSLCTSAVSKAEILAANVCLDYSFKKYSSFEITVDSTTGASAITYYFGAGCTNPDSTAGGAFPTDSVCTQTALTTWLKIQYTAGTTNMNQVPEIINPVVFRYTAVLICYYYNDRYFTLFFSFSVGILLRLTVVVILTQLYMKHRHQ